MEDSEKDRRRHIRRKPAYTTWRNSGGGKGKGRAHGNWQEFGEPDSSDDEEHVSARERQAANPMVAVATQGDMSSNMPGSQ